MRRIVCEDSLLPLLLRERLLTLRAKHVIAKHEAEVRRVLSDRNDTERPSADQGGRRQERRRNDR